MPPGKLGLRFQSQPAFDDRLRVAGSSTATSDTTWEQPWGERRYVRDHHNELLVNYESAAGAPRKFSVRVRVFDDGFGFRYEVPEQPGYADVAITDELTEFRLEDDPKTTAWWIPGRRYNRYEYLYNTTGLDAIQMAHTPMTVRLPSGVHLSFHEAALVDYAAYVLDQRRDGVFKTNLTPWSDGIRVKTRAPFRTPWRTVQVAPSAATLLNSSLILNLNEPNALGDVSWVKPGKYVGIWWAMHIKQATWGSGPEHGATTAATKRYIDFAASNGFDGVLVEGWNVGWDGDWFHNGKQFRFTEPYPDFDLKGVTDYARRKGVRLDRSPRNRRRPRQLRATDGAPRSTCTSRSVCGRSRQVTWPTPAISVASTRTASSSTSGTTDSSRSATTSGSCARRPGARSASSPTSP